MLDNKIVSIIIPVYNVENYLEECLESIINQTYKNIEIILVNDGSTDNSLQVIEKYRAKDSRIIVYNQKNQGLGKTRNNAIRKCNGEYILFLDSDDYLELNCIEVLLTKQNEISSEITIFDAKGFYIENNKKHYDKTKYFNIDEKRINKLYTGSQVSKFTIECVSSCLKLYKTEFLKKNNIYFSTIGVGEDVEFWYKCCANAKSVIAINYIGYYRRYRPGSIMQTENSKSIKERILSLSNIKQYFDLIGEFEKNKFIREGIANYTKSLYIKSLKFEKAEYKLLRAELEKVEAKEILWTYSFGKYKKIMRVAMYNSPKILNRIWKLKRKIINIKNNYI